MKTERLQRGDDGGYANSIASLIRLDAGETRAIRKVLAKAQEPLHISAIGKAAGIDPRKTGQLSEFISNYLQNTSREVQMCFEHTERGKRFTGWRMTEHGKDLFEHVG